MVDQATDREKKMVDHAAGVQNEKLFPKPVFTKAEEPAAKEPAAAGQKPAESAKPDPSNPNMPTPAAPKPAGAPTPAADRYQNNPVTVQRPARPGDAGWIDGPAQVWIRLADGTEKAVLRSDVTRS